MDIEWVLAADRCCIVQARPITTLRGKRQGRDARAPRPFLGRG